MYIIQAQGNNSSWVLNEVYVDQAQAFQDISCLITRLRWQIEYNLPWGVHYRVLKCKTHRA
jgi:hypothetical protein